MQSIEPLGYKDEKLITKCDQLFLSFFELYSENVVENENELVENENELIQAVKKFYENPINQKKVILFLEHLKTKIGFASDDDSSMLDICQKSSGTFFFKKIIEKWPSQEFSNSGTIVDWPLMDNILEIEAALKIRARNFACLDEEYIPQIMVQRYKDEHWWWFPRRKIRSKKKSN